MRLASLLAAALLCSATVHASAPWITLYDEDNQTGNNVTFSWSISNLRKWKDKAKSYCMVGFWMLFEMRDFGTDMDGLRTVTQVCDNLDDLKVKSVRQIGDPDDVLGKSLSLFKGEFYGGDLTYLVDDTPSILNGGRFNSAAISGNQSWSIYSQENYGGHVTCLYVHDEYFPIYGWFDYASDMGDSRGKVKSARKGCAGNMKATMKGQQGRNFDRIAFSTPGNHRHPGGFELDIGVVNS